MANFKDPIHHRQAWACTGFDRDLEDGEAIRRRCVKSQT